MVPGTFPGWLLKRASEMRAHRIITLLSPEQEHDQCAYLLELSDGIYELHVAEDGHAGVEAATLTFSRRKLVDFIGQFFGAISGKRLWTTVPQTDKSSLANL